MSIKSDKWIRRMAREYGMIEPFSPELVREVDGQKIVSYGTSSYGYDIRCADEFRVFTNINHTIVDPKAFDPDSFVEVSGKGHCVIPPNSFALAAPSNISASRARCSPSASARAPMRAAASSSMSRPSNPNGKAT
jgi:deoxycytidine triphosphate deaminase